MGAGSDLQLYHDGSNSYIQNSGTGDLIIYGTGETLAKFIDDGAVELYHNNSKKFYTHSGGAYCDGNLGASGELYLPDNGELVIGTGDDLKLFHNGTDSIIDNATGNLKVIAPNDVTAIQVYNDGTVNIGSDTDNIKLRFGIGSDLQIYHDASNSYLLNNTGDLILDNDQSGSNNILAKAKAEFIAYVNSGADFGVRCQNAGATTIYHSGNAKLATASYGADLTGALVASGDIKAQSDGGKIMSGASDDLQVYYDGTNSIIDHTHGSGTIFVRGDALTLQSSQSTPENYLHADANGAVTLYHNNAAKIATASGGVTITGTATATAFAGDGSALTGLAGGGGEFNTSISEYANYTLTTSMATAFTANSSSSHRTIVHSCRITNYSASEVTVSGELYGSKKFAHLIPIPANSSVELLKKPKVLGASATIELQCSANSSLEATVSAERQENTDLAAASVESTDTGTNTLVTLSGAAVFESILCTNDDGTNDVKATVTWTNSSGTVQSYLSYDLVIPAGASVELLEKPLAMPSGHKLRVTANIANRLCTIAAFKLAS